ncbi:hypothetical protein [Natronorubrum texcoconense]|uniref:Uncharacterized protein n=1 Tax=Natronorubrum texcoconense TaxID=1095776 RepID=A0A1G8UIS4_9EURY|nr:hypothetical protein [Natronorubrum texcoconense]SDJ53712.1 hypothetical protein SAMN04515672_0907 [Natronorubrum texcoconense]
MNRQHAVFAAGALALFTAIVHLVFGMVDLYNWLVNGDSVSILPFAFVAFSLIVFLLIYTYSKGLLREAQAYAAGAAVMFLPIVGYADWHAAGITESALGLDDAGLGHEHSHDGDGHDHNGDDDHSHDDGHSHDDDHNGDDGHSHDDDHDHNGDDDHDHNGADDHDHNGDDHSHDDDHDHNGDDHSHDGDAGHEHSHDDEGGVIEVTIDHLRDDMMALSTKVAEFAAFVLFTALAIAER